jgi:hypothetical protein
MPSSPNQTYSGRELASRQIAGRFKTRRDGQLTEPSYPWRGLHGDAYHRETTTMLPMHARKTSLRKSQHRERPRLEHLEVRALLATSAFYNNFDSPPTLLQGVTGQVSGVTTTESVQGYAGLGTGTNIFSGQFLRNTTGGPSGIPGSPTVLTLNNLPPHQSISLGFLFALIDSWDGNGAGDSNTSASPDFFNVTVDGNTIFSTKMGNAYEGDSEYVPPPGVELAHRLDLGFTSGQSFYLDSAFNFGLDPRFSNISHSSSSLTITWFANGSGWQGGNDESWGIDNVEVLLNGVNPDLAVTPPTWNTNNGGVDFGYTITGADLTKPTTAALYWSTDTTFDAGDTLITGSVTPTQTAQTPPGSSVPVHIDAAALQNTPPPTGTKYLLAVVDPNDTVTESDETNNVQNVAYDPFSADTATSPDSLDISFTYEVNEATPGQPFNVAVYRSATATFSLSTAIQVGQDFPIPAVDTSNQSSVSLGKHTVLLNDPLALHPDPAHEYVFVVPDPKHLYGDPGNTIHEAHFRKFVLGAVVHGFELLGGVSGVPQWETQTASDLVLKNSYDLAIPFDWSSTCNVAAPGLAYAAGDRLTQQITSDADALVQRFGHPGDVVDLHLIGHSRGAVVISRVLLDLLGTPDTALAGGFKIMTMLDPHPANNGFALQDYSATKAGLAFVSAYRNKQAAMQDQQVVIPPNVDEAQEYYQQTPASDLFLGHNSPWEAYVNFWGEDPRLIINDSLATLEVHPLSAVVDRAIGPIGHSEVPLYYGLYELPQLKNKGYGKSGGLL